MNRIYNRTTPLIQSHQTKKSPVPFRLAGTDRCHPSPAEFRRETASDLEKHSTTMKYLRLSMPTQQNVFFAWNLMGPHGITWISTGIGEVRRTTS